MTLARTLLIAITLVVGVLPAGAVQPDEILANPALESRARALSRELRCMVCQNQSIDDSDAPLARDLRLLVRERLVAGDSDAQVMDFLTTRYGEFVLLKPRFGVRTALLWIAPALVLLIGAIWLIFFLRRRPDVPSGELAGEGDLSPAEKARLAQLLSDHTGNRR
jgi:cytochrome c-type biogenesis protein CcmH